MAGGCGSLKMKRKDLDDVNDDFSDFSLSSPARKIRRLDAELPPIMEEEEAMPVANEHSSAMEELGSSENEERAIVLFKPMNAHLLHSTSPNFIVSVDSDIISGFKNQFPWSNQSDCIKPLEEEAQSDEETNECRAVVPWVPSQFPIAHGSDVSPSQALEEMEAEEMGEAAMDVEEDNSNVAEQGSVFELGGIRGSDGLPQWQQQHCMIPQFPQNNSTPITWFQ